MPAAIAAAKLSTVKPTAEELDRAKQLRADASSSKKRSLDQGFKDYIRKHVEQNPELRDSSSAVLKEECLMNFMVLQMRSKGNKTLTAVHQAEIKSSKIAEKHWWNEFQLDTKLGPAVGKHWRDSALLQRRPCPVTGSEEASHLVYGVPVLWESLTENDLKLLRLETAREAQTGDAEAITEFSDISRASLTDAGTADGTKELTPKAHQEAFIEDLAKSPSTYLRKYQEMTL